MSSFDNLTLCNTAPDALLLEETVDSATLGEGYQNTDAADHNDDAPAPLLFDDPPQPSAEYVAALAAAEAEAAAREAAAEAAHAAAVEAAAVVQREREAREAAEMNAKIKVRVLHTTQNKEKTLLILVFGTKTLHYYIRCSCLTLGKTFSSLFDIMPIYTSHFRCYDTQETLARVQAEAAAAAEADRARFLAAHEAHVAASAAAAANPDPETVIRHRARTAVMARAAQLRRIEREKELRTARLAAKQSLTSVHAVLSDEEELAVQQQAMDESLPHAIVSLTAEDEDKAQKGADKAAKLLAEGFADGAEAMIAFLGGADVQEPLTQAEEAEEASKIKWRSTPVTDEEKAAVAEAERVRRAAAARGVGLSAAEAAELADKEQTIRESRDRQRRMERIVAGKHSEGRLERAEAQAEANRMLGFIEAMKARVKELREKGRDQARQMLETERKMAGLSEEQKEENERNLRDAAAAAAAASTSADDAAKSQKQRDIEEQLRLAEEQARADREREAKEEEEHLKSLGGQKPATTPSAAAAAAVAAGAVGAKAHAKDEL